MRLLNPSPGEILDRMTILELKITFGHKKGVSTTHFEAEYAELQEALKGWTDSLPESYYFDDDNGTNYQELMDKMAMERNGLAAVNALLWDAEDRVRLLPETEAFTLARLAKQIVAWNDARARHVQGLNKLYMAGDEQEKLYETKK